MALFDLVDQLVNFSNQNTSNDEEEGVLEEWNNSASDMYHFTRRALDKKYIPDKNKICNPTYYLNSNGKMDVSIFLQKIDKALIFDREFSDANPMKLHDSGLKNWEFWDFIDKNKINY